MVINLPLPLKLLLSERTYIGTQISSNIGEFHRVQSKFKLEFKGFPLLVVLGAEMGGGDTSFKPFLL